MANVDDGPDPLYALKVKFHLGAYQEAISAADDLRGGAAFLTEGQEIERDAYAYMAYGAIGATQIVLSEVSEDSPLALRAVRLQVEFLEDPAGQAGAVEAALEDLLSDPSSSSNGVLLYVAGVIYNYLGRFDDALKLNQTGVTLENLSLCVAIGIAIDRPDFAEKMVKRMSEWDDDATITQLATAWLGAYGGGALARDALIIYEELGGRWSWTPKLLNGAATTCMVMHEWEEAEQHLMNALTKDPKDADTLANLYVVSKNLHKNAERYLSQLSTIAPDHPLIAKRASLETAFDQAAHV